MDRPHATQLLEQALSDGFRLAVEIFDALPEPRTRAAVFDRLAEIAAGTAPFLEPDAPGVGPDLRREIEERAKFLAGHVVNHLVNRPDG